MNSSQLKNSSFYSPLEMALNLKESSAGGKSKSNMLAPILPLTSLIDAFCIIVIYLLIGTQSGTVPMDMPAHINLPSAETGVALEESPIIRIEKGNYFINNTFVPAQQLGTQLYQLKQSLKSEDTQVIVQADEKMNYADLDALIKAGSQAGIQKLKFAVMPIQ